MDPPLTTNGSPDHGAPDPMHSQLWATPPALHPISDDLLAVIGLLMVENDAMRDELGHAVVGRRRVFSNEDLSRGRTLGANAMMPDGNSLVVRLES